MKALGMAVSASCLGGAAIPAAACPARSQSSPSPHPRLLRPLRSRASAVTASTSCRRRRRAPPPPLVVDLLSLHRLPHILLVPSAASPARPPPPPPPLPTALPHHSPRLNQIGLHCPLQPQGEPAMPAGDGGLGGLPGFRAPPPFPDLATALSTAFP